MQVPCMLPRMTDTLPQIMTREEYEAMNETLVSLADASERMPVRIRREFDRKRVAEAFESAFEMIGGVQRLAVWAHENPTEFFKLFGRMLPTGTQVDLNASGEIIYKHVLPPSKLDRLEDQSGE